MEMAGTGTIVMDIVSTDGITVVIMGTMDMAVATEVEGMAVATVVEGIMVEVVITKYNDVSVMYSNRLQLYIGSDNDSLH